MTFSNRLWPALFVVLVTCVDAGADDTYICRFEGETASYHADEVPRMTSLGADCAPAGEGERILCAVGSVQSYFLHSERDAVLAGNPRVVCETDTTIVTNVRAAVVATTQTTTTVIDEETRPTFSIDGKRVVHFALNSHYLAPSERAKLFEFADLYGGGDHWITITGHTDSSGGNAYNHLLSLRRAGAVRDALADLGVDLDRILSVSALGEESLRHRHTRGGRSVAYGRPYVLNRAVELKAYR